jgi:hypothetical protein
MATGTIGKVKGKGGVKEAAHKIGEKIATAAQSAKQAVTGKKKQPVSGPKK